MTDPFHQPPAQGVNQLVDELRAERPDTTVPYVDPIYNAANATILSLLSDPGPMASGRAGSGVLSVRNEDESARRLGRAFEAAGLSFDDVCPWNGFPWYQHEDKEGDNSLSAAQREEGVSPLIRLLERHPQILWIVAHGGNAADVVRRARKRPEFQKLAEARDLRVVEVRHTSARAFGVLNPERRRAEFRRIVDAYVEAMISVGLTPRPLAEREQLIEASEPIRARVDIDARLDALREAEELDGEIRALVRALTPRERSALLVQLIRERVVGADPIADSEDRNRDILAPAGREEADVDRLAARRWRRAVGQEDGPHLMVPLAAEDAQTGGSEVSRAAVLSPDGVYRYKFTREWDPARGRVMFVMLNPSIADGLVDDRTIGRCMSFAEQWGYGGIDVVNLYGFRATDPQVMKRAADPVGPENDRYLREAVSAAPLIVCAWGTHADASRVYEFKKLAEGRELFCLGTNSDGSPKHPLYVVGATQPIRWGDEE